MEKIIRTLDLHRTWFTQIFDTTNELRTKETIDMSYVWNNIQLLEQKMQNISHFDQRYLSLLLDQDPEGVELDSEMTKLDKYIVNSQFYKWKWKRRLIYQ